MTAAEDGAPGEWTIDWRCKSFPPAADGLPAARVADARWRVLHDFTTPVAVLKQDALTHNLDRMREYCSAHGVAIAPHGKTTMSPELVAAQLEYGAWGMTAATAWQARAMVAFGARRVMIANECLDPVGLGWVAAYLRDHPEVEIYAFVDSLAAVEAMQAVLRDRQADDGASVGSHRPVPVLVELGVSGMRAGARDVGSAVEVGRAVTKAPELELAGVAG